MPPPLIAAYPHATDAQAQQARLDLERDLRFAWDVWTWARLQSVHGRAYFYHFMRRPPFPEGSIHHDWGASHFAELWYMFDHLDQETVGPVGDGSTTGGTDGGLLDENFVEERRSERRRLAALAGIR